MSQDTYLGISFGTWLTYVEPLVFEMDLKSEKQASYKMLGNKLPFLYGHNIVTLFFLSKSFPSASRSYFLLPPSLLLNHHEISLHFTLATQNTLK